MEIYIKQICTSVIDYYNRYTEELIRLDSQC